MAKSNDSSKKAANPAVGSKATVTDNATQTNSDTTPKEPAMEKLKAPVASKTMLPGTEKTKAPATEKDQAPAKQTAKKEAANKAAAAVKADDVKKGSTPKESVAEPAQTAKGAFTKKMDEVKSTATVIGHKISDFAKEANEKTEGFEDAVASGLHEMKKDIHKFAVNIAEKTKE